jgi:hypothetical protein
MTFPQCLPFAYADLESDDGAPRTKTAIMTPESKESTSGGVRGEVYQDRFVGDQDLTLWSTRAGRALAAVVHRLSSILGPHSAVDIRWRRSPWDHRPKSRPACGAVGQAFKQTPWPASVAGTGR